ncbi:MAG TPA: DinB family protein [Flavipsychrobacter sp.]|jgi:uncharacterized damage-inducible protein DinB|nr:DinB family protein [Flavipsychrobacter sp.]
MKETLLRYADYNIWANKRIIDTLLQLDEEQIDQKIESSFPTIRKTVYHAWSAEYIWLQRLQLAEQPIWIEGVFNGSFEQGCMLWQDVSLELRKFVGDQYEDKSFSHVLQYYDRKKQSFKTPVCDVLMHLFNHATYHRGQLITMMRQCGVRKVPGTDFITFARK